MAWNHIVLEAFCFCSPEDGERPPSYCRFGPGNPDVHCFVGRPSHPPHFEQKEKEDSEQLPCPFASWSKSASTAVLTDQDGRVELYKSYSIDPEAEDDDYEGQLHRWQASMVQKFVE
jgi:hypothetical protein